MLQKIINKLGLFFRTLFFILGIMVLPILVLDLLVAQTNYIMLWWSLLFSTILAAIDVIFDEVPIFREKLMLKRIVFFILLTAVAMGTSWIMKIITTIPILLSGIAGCAIVIIPVTLYLYRVEKKKAALLNESLREYNEHSGDE